MCVQKVGGRDACLSIRLSDRHPGTSHEGHAPRCTSDSLAPPRKWCSDFNLFQMFVHLCFFYYVARTRRTVAKHSRYHEQAVDSWYYSHSRSTETELLTPNEQRPNTS